MKRTVIVGLVVGSAIVAAGIVSILFAGDKAPKASTAPTTLQKVSAACKLFTLSDAAAILGPEAKNVKSSMDAYSTDAEITVCRYAVRTGPDPEDVRSVSVLVRLVKAAEGASYNKSIFGEKRPAGKQTVEGVGDAAFWDGTLSQLNLLMGDTWYIIENMDGMQSGSGDLSTSRAVYDQIKSKL